MPITKKERLLVETICDACKSSMGTSLIEPAEYGDWLKHTIELLTFEFPQGPPKILCWDCIKRLGFIKEYDRRLNALTYPPEGPK